MKTMIKKIQHSVIIPEEANGQRLDQVLVKLLPEYSRVLIQKWIKAGELRLNHKVVKPKTLVLGGEAVTLETQMEAKTVWVAQPLPLTVIFEDEALLIINKPIGLIVHPGSGNPDNTLVNALLHRNPELELLPRAGLVHRLDKDTSGLLVIAKTLPAYNNLVKQLKARTIRREYQTLVSGTIISGGTVDAPMARHPLQRKRMAIIETGRPAITHYRVLEKFRSHTRLKVRLETGRTHQIRVHMTSIQHPIIGDSTYGERLRLPKGATPALVTALRQFKHQALHADELGLIHPVSEEEMAWKIELPDDFQKLLLALREDTQLFNKANKNYG
jgi:23S rRNA pseudouridine1911/1915/1917 synthase